VNTQCAKNAEILKYHATVIRRRSISIEVFHTHSSLQALKGRYAAAT